jgi:hypothetical protein
MKPANRYFVDDPLISELVDSLLRLECMVNLDQRVGP